jgi:hypothetical protein
MATRRDVLAGMVGAAGAWALGGLARATGGAPAVVTMPLRPGRSNLVAVTGAAPGEAVELWVGTGGLGGPTCPAALGGACLDLAGSVQPVGRAVADASGLARLTLPVPAAAAGRVIGLQAVLGAPGAQLVAEASLVRVLGARCAATSVNALGPYYLPGSPLRDDFDLYGEPGTPFTLQGHLVTTGCAAIAGATIEVWHADPAGDYDNLSPEMRYRGALTTGATGQFCLRTLRPGAYAQGGAARPTHLHLRVSTNGVERLVTQLYPADDPLAATTPAARPDLLLQVFPDPAGGQRAATWLAI